MGNQVSQKELGVRAGMDDSSASGRMNHYERGRHVPDIDTMRKLANVLGKPLSYFFCEDDLSAELVCLFEQLDEDEKLDLLFKLRENKR
ncbi:helix-turn-helix domain-containing protein [Aeromonas caviae]|uniref:helix-turn-helix domain-containing protein n=1 Tax=Aeromonas caviae TaxID=648 RepID=UPI001CC77CCE|nr:helix-turn-helix transcriptional regulator [Aeromonas caviae]GJA69734.1 transcriptional regulator [Aeromonas caviae]